MNLFPETPDTESTSGDSGQALRDKLSSLATPEEKIAQGLVFMRISISQEGAPRFREFWEARKIVLPCFKENLNSAIRSKLWGEYVELTMEARRLKEILEEQSAFAMEQIDLAISALEADTANFEAIASAGKALALPTIQAKSESYHHIQRELNLLNTLASRLNGLRKEVIKTDMRVRFKTKFFKRLTDVGDQIFPKRKQLIDQISTEFQKDVEQFIHYHFAGDHVGKAPYFALREEVKSLQGMAKMLTLSSGVFNRTRLKLSECWDKIKLLEKEHKKGVHAKRQLLMDNRLNIEQKIQDLSTRSVELALSDLDRAIGEISQEMRKVELHRDDVIVLRERLSELRAPHLAIKAEKNNRLEQSEQEKARLKQNRLLAMKEKIAILLKEGRSMDLDALEASIHALKEEIKTLGLVKLEQQSLDRQLRELKDFALERKERRLLDLSEDDRHALEDLRALLDQKKKRRQEIKEQIETYRRALGSSSLDFEKGMLYREQMEQERGLLDRMNQGIEEIENKISDLERD